MHNRLKSVQNPQQIKQVRQLSGLAYIPTCRSPIVDHHETQNRPSPTMRRNVFHSTHGPRRSGKFVAPRWPPSNVLSIFQFLTLGAYPPGQRSPKGEITYYSPRSTILQNFSTMAQTVYEICVTKALSRFGPWGANPWAKVHQKGRWPGGHRGLPSSKVLPPYVHPCRRYLLQKSCGQRNKQTNKQKNKQTVNDISTACLSACVDNKQ